MHDILITIFIGTYAFVWIFCIYIWVREPDRYSERQSFGSGFDRHHGNHWHKLATRRLVYGIIATVILLPICLIGWQRSMASMFNNPKTWVPIDFDARMQLMRFGYWFNEIDTVIVSWHDCTVDDPRLEQLARALTDPGDANYRPRCRDLFSRASTGYTALRELMDSPLELSRQQAIARLTGSLVGPDGRNSCAVVELSRLGDRRRTEALELLQEIARDACQLDPAELRLGGTPVDGVTIDRHSIGSAKTLSLPCNLLVLIVCLVCLRSWVYTLVVFAIAVLGQVFSLALVHLAGQPMNAILIVIPPLAMVLTVSAGVHLVNYYHEAVRLQGVEGAASRAITNGRLPCLLAAATTVIGLLSLLVSDILPIRMFGAFAALTIVMAISLLFLMLPGAMYRWPVANTHGAAGWIGVGVTQGIEKAIDALATFVCRYRNTVAICCLSAMLVAGCGLVALKTSINVRSLFLPDSRIVKDYRWLEERIGPMVPMEVVVRFSNACPLEQLERFRVIRDVHKAIEKIDGVGGIISAATFFPELVNDDQTPSTQEAQGMEQQVRQFLPRFAQLHYVHAEPEAQYWRVRTRAAALQDIDYGLFQERLREKVEPIVDSIRAEVGYGSIRTIYTGAMPLAYDIQRELLRNLLASFVTALIIITAVIMLVLRSIRGGLIAMLANVFPTITLFGLISLLKIPVDIGSVMTASVALGIAVDDTFHFLTWFRREHALCRDRWEAIRRAYRHCARAMVQTTLICGLGLFVYNFSTFVPTQKFSWMMITLLLAALVGDLLLLPALIAGPMGKWFEPRDDSVFVQPEATIPHESSTQPVVMG